MEEISIRATIDQLDKRRGGYHFLPVSPDVVDKLNAEEPVRLICTISGYQFQCGLGHLGDGNRTIILSLDKLKKLNLGKGDQVSFIITSDPDPLGAEMPESLQILLEEDPVLRAKFESITDGKKRGLIHYIASTKNIDLQVKRALYVIDKYGH